MIELFWEGFVGAFLASLGFGILFNIRGRFLLLAGFTGGLGSLVYMGAKRLGLGEAFANLLGAMVLSIVAEIFARTQKTTVTTFTICALIPLVPGGTAYNMMNDFIHNNIAKGLNEMVDMVMVSLMLVLGIVLVSNVVRLIRYIRKAVRNKAAPQSRQSA